MKSPTPERSKEGHRITPKIKTNTHHSSYGTFLAARQSSHGIKTETQETTKNLTKNRARGETRYAPKYKPQENEESSRKRCTQAPQNGENKTSKRQATHQRKTRDLPRELMEKPSKMAPTHPQEIPATPPPHPHQRIHSHRPNHIHQNHRFLHTRTQLSTGHQEIHQVLQHKNRRQTTTDTNNNKQIPSKCIHQQIQTHIQQMRHLRRILKAQGKHKGKL
jgi:hypothetical protein